MNCFKPLSIILLLVLSVSVFADTRYVVIFDAGSSGTRAHLYKNQSESHAIPKISEIKIANNEVKPGIASLASEPDKIAEYLQPITTQLLQVLSSADIQPKAVDAYFLATAGMRLIPEDQQKPIYTQVKIYLAQQQLNLKKAMTIPGWQEGVFGWSSLNYLNGSLHNQPAKTFGFMDMGGASTQIVFENTAVANHILQLAGDTYPLYAKSYLGLGINQSMAKLKNAPSCFSTGYILPDGAKALGDSAACQLQVYSVLNLSQVTPVITDSEQVPFVTASGFYYTVTSPAIGLDSPFTVSQLNSAANKLCQKSWSSLSAQYPDNPYIYSHCYTGSYLSALLKQYGFSENTPIAAQKKVNGTKLGWALGADLYYSANHFLN